MYRDLYTRLQMLFNDIEKDPVEKAYKLSDSIWQKTKSLYKKVTSGEYDIKPEITETLSNIVKLADELKYTLKNLKIKSKI